MALTASSGMRVLVDKASYMVVPVPGAGHRTIKMILWDLGLATRRTSLLPGSQVFLPSPKIPGADIWWRYFDG